MVQGQTEASTNATGFAHADSLIFGAVPETYPLELSLPDYYPQVLLMHDGECCTCAYTCANAHNLVALSCNEAHYT